MKIDMVSGDRFMGRLERALDTLSRRQSLLATNVANLDTPNFKAVDIDFAAAMRRAMSSEAPAALNRAGSHPAAGAGSGKGFAGEQVRPVRDLATRNDGNNVDIDREMMALAQTRGRYEVSATLLRMRLRQLRLAASDGRSSS